jgi:hypothetical protein
MQVQHLIIVVVVVTKKTATEGSEIAMPSWPMIGYQAETWCFLVTHSLSHVRLALLGIASPTFGLCIIIIIIIIIIIKSIDYCNRINCIHSVERILRQSGIIPAT